MKCSLLVLSSYLDGELDARRDGELEAHLVGCQRCRAGLGYLREEVERVSALGRVHVADHSVHALLSTLGLIDEDEPLPEQSQTAIALAEHPGRAPAWMGADDATSMPWALAGSSVPSPQVIEEPGLVEPVEAVEEELAGVPDATAFAPPEAEVELQGETEFPDELLAEFEAAIAEEHPEEPQGIEVHTAPPPDDSHEADLADMYGEAALADAPDPSPPAQPQPHTAPAADAEQPAFRWIPPLAPAPPTAAAMQTPEAPSSPGRPPFTWSPPPAATTPGPPAAADEEGVPAVPFAFDSGRSGDLPAPSLTPPAPEHGPPPGPDTPDQAPSASSGGAFPPGGPEHVDPSDLPEHATAPGGEPEMTASPPWAPHDAPASAPLYPMTDDDVLGEPVPVERFGPPPQAARPGLFERLRDRLAVRRALSRSSSAYDDQVQIVSGMGAPLRPGRARLEVERRRQETLRMDPGGIPGEAVAGYPDPDDAGDALDDDDLGLGPLPPPLPDLHTPMPRPPAHPAAGPGQMALPGTSVSDPFDPGASDPRAPIHRVPMPPPRHTLGSALGDPPPSSPPPFRPPLPPRPPVSPPPPPKPDPLGEALSDFDRPTGGGTTYEPRPWRPREVADEVETAPPPRRFAADPAGPAQSERGRHSPSQLRDGRRLLAIFGAATLLMFVVGIVSGRTTSPRPASSTSTTAPTHAAPAKPKASQPAVNHPATQGPIALAPNAQPSQSTGTPQLTGTKVLGDGATGFQVKDFRYGIHPDDFRIVLDLEGAAGSPKVTIGFLDSTTLLVALDGVVPAGSVGALPTNNPVTSITLMQQSPFPGATTYQIKLAHPVTFTAGYVPGPLRLVLDLAG